MYHTMNWIPLQISCHKTAGDWLILEVLVAKLNNIVNGFTVTGTWRNSSFYIPCGSSHGMTWEEQNSEEEYQAKLNDCPLWPRLEFDEDANSEWFATEPINQPVSGGTQNVIFNITPKSKESKKRLQKESDVSAGSAYVPSKKMVPEKTQEKEEVPTHKSHAKKSKKTLDEVADVTKLSPRTRTLRTIYDPSPKKD